MFDGTFIEAFEESLQPKVLTINNRQYSTELVHNAPLPNEPGYPTVVMFSLDSLVDFVARNPVESSFVNADAQAAFYLSPPVGENRKRDMLAQAKPNVGSFAFGQYVSLEEFRIAMLTQFQETVFRAQILAFVSKITDTNVKTSEDDGVSQSITMKTGIASYGEGQVPSPVRLQPIRTFIEVEQPEGLFVLRLQQVKDALPKIGLFELHTNWQRSAALSVKEYLESKKCAVPVFA